MMRIGVPLHLALVFFLDMLGTIMKKQALMAHRRMRWTSLLSLRLPTSDV
jgi:hypothetical protein